MFKSLLLLLAISTGVFAQSKHVVAISHRGEHLHHPENTIAAFQAAVDAGADFFELDVRTTSDGELVLMHDSTVDRTTNGKGQIANMTFAEIRKLEAGAKMGDRFRGTRVPSFDEALAFAHGKIGVYIDSKRISAADVTAAVARHDMRDHVVVYGNLKYLAEVHKLSPKMKFMPEAKNAANLKSLLDTLPLKVVAFDAQDFTDQTITLARKARVDIYVDRLGAADNPASWQDAINRGATGIQTDHPAELVEYLKSKGYR
ncbi:MAG: glycerophosphodiester phosphodiesterase family protein [Bryobacteraceae bacterium]